MTKSACASATRIRHPRHVLRRRDIIAARSRGRRAARPPACRRSRGRACRASRRSPRAAGPRADFGHDVLLELLEALLLEADRVDHKVLRRPVRRLGLVVEEPDVDKVGDRDLPRRHHLEEGRLARAVLRDEAVAVAVGELDLLVFKELLPNQRDRELRDLDVFEWRATRTADTTASSQRSASACSSFPARRGWCPAFFFILLVAFASGFFAAPPTTTPALPPPPPRRRRRRRRRRPRLRRLRRRRRLLRLSLSFFRAASAFFSSPSASSKSHRRQRSSRPRRRPCRPHHPLALLVRHLAVELLLHLEGLLGELSPA